MRPTISFRRRRFSRRRGITACFPVRKRKTQRAEQAWLMTVARAAPRTPQWKTKMNTGSRAMLRRAPISTVSIPVRAKPWALIKGFMPTPVRTNTVPAR